MKALNRVGRYPEAMDVMLADGQGPEADLARRVSARLRQLCA